MPFTCDCGDLRCFAMVMVTLTAYGAIRGNRRRFVLLLGHENAPEERVVDGGARGYIVVEMLADAV